MWCWWRCLEGPGGSWWLYLHPHAPSLGGPHLIVSPQLPWTLMMRSTAATLTLMVMKPLLKRHVCLNRLVTSERHWASIMWVNSGRWISKWLWRLVWFIFQTCLQFLHFPFSHLFLVSYISMQWWEIPFFAMRVVFMWLWVWIYGYHWIYATIRYHTTQNI